MRRSFWLSCLWFGLLLPSAAQAKGEAPTPPAVPEARPPAAPAAPAAPEPAQAPGPKEKRPTPAPGKEAPVTAAPQATPTAPEEGPSEAAAAPASEAAEEALPPIQPIENPPAPPPRSRRSRIARPKDSSPPSLTLEALQNEIKNSPAEVEKNNLLEEREKLGELVSALDVAQKQLREDTERLSQYLEEVKKQSQEKATQEEQRKAAEAVAAAEKAQAAKGPPGASPLEVLSKAMRGMKPAQAAAIAERLPLSLAADVMQKMPARDAGRVMGLMNPARGAEVAAEIASRDEEKKAGAR